MDEKKAPERIILGSGYIHLATFKKGQTIPEPQDFCTKENRYSYIKNGATPPAFPYHRTESIARQRSAASETGRARNTLSVFIM